MEQRAGNEQRVKILKADLSRLADCSWILH